MSEHRYAVVPVALLVVAVGLLLHLLLQTPSSHTVDMGTPSDSRFSAGFFPREAGDGSTVRWSGPKSELVLHGTSGSQILELRLHGGQLGGSNHNQLALQRNGKTVAALAVQPDWHAYHTLVPSDASSAAFGEAPRLRLVSALFPTGTDNRKVGVALDWLRLASTERGMFQVQALSRTLVLTWMLAVLAGLFFCADGMSRRSTIRARTWRVSGVISAVGAMLLWWAWYDPYVLAWFLPAMPWVLGSLTFGLVCVVVRARAVFAPSSLRLAMWRRYGFSIGLAALAVAQTLFVAQRATSLGIVLVLLGFVLILPTFWFHQSSSPTPSVDPRVHFDGASQQLLGRRSAGALLVLIVLVALGLRFYRIDELPYGLWRDEARHGLVALRMLEQPDYRPVYVPSVDLPALGLYPFALALKTWGIHAWSMRPVTVLAGALTALPLYGLVCRLWGRRGLALLAAALLMVAQWNLTISRLSFPHIFDPLLTLTGLWLLLVGLQSLEQRRGMSWSNTMVPLLLAGSCFGLALYTYHTGRLAPLFAAALALCWLLGHPHQWRRWFVAGFILVLAYLVVTSPLLRYAVEHPASFNGRVNEVGLLSEATLNGRAPLAVLDEAVKHHVLMFNVHGDENGRHNAPGRPMLDWASGLGFLVGLAVIFARWRHWQSKFLLAALLLGILPSFLAVDAPHALRSFDAAAFAMVISALGWSRVGGLAWQHGRVSTWSISRFGGGSTPAIVAGSIVVSLALVLNAWSYFITMPSDPAVWKAFYPVQTQIGTALRGMAEEEGAEQLRSVYMKQGIAEHTVTRYLLHGLETQTFDGTAFSSPPKAGALFVLSGYHYQDDAADLAAYIGTAPVPTLLGPPLPDGITPSFVIYAVK